MTDRDNNKQHDPANDIVSADDICSGRAVNDSAPTDAPRRANMGRRAAATAAAATAAAGAGIAWAGMGDDDTQVASITFEDNDEPAGTDRETEPASAPAGSHAAAPHSATSHVTTATPNAPVHPAMPANPAETTEPVLPAETAVPAEPSEEIEVEIVTGGDEDPTVEIIEPEIEEPVEIDIDEILDPEFIMVDDDDEIFVVENREEETVIEDDPFIDGDDPSTWGITPEEPAGYETGLNGQLDETDITDFDDI